MFRKVLTAGLLAVMAGAIVIGVIQLADGSGAERGSGRSSRAGAQVSGLGSPATETQENARYGRGSGGANRATTEPNAGESWQGGYGRGQAGEGIGQGSGTPEQQVRAEEWQTVEGIVVDPDVMTLKTATGETLAIGLGPSHYREGQGFALQVGERVQVTGFYEDGEFKAGQVTKLATGETIALRDTSGRPLWAGNGRSGNRLATGL
jgi:hypothetical protein